MISLALVSLLSAAPVLTVPAIADDLPAELERQIPCRLAGQTFTLRFQSEFGPVGSSAIANVTQSVRLDDRFVWERLHFEGEPAVERVRFECDGARMRVLFDSGRFVDWLVDSKTRSLVPAPALSEELAQLWAADAKDASARVAELAWFFEFLPVGSVPPRLTLLQARDALLRGELVRAEELLRVNDDGPWKVVLLDELAKRLARVPYRFVDRVKIGLAQWKPSLLEEGEVLEYFWQGERFCVVQQDGSKTMRCFDVRTKKWSGRSAAISAPFVPHIANSVRFDVCSREPRRCVSCYSFFDALPDGSWIGVDRGRLWLARTPLDGSRLESLSEEKASALQARGFGGALFGGAQFVLQPTAGLNDFTAVSVARPDSAWRPLPSAPHGWEWRNILVSPDQHFVAVFAFPTTAPDAQTQGEWWLFRIAENR